MIKYEKIENKPINPVYCHSLLFNNLKIKKKDIVSCMKEVFIKRKILAKYLSERKNGKDNISPGFDRKCVI